MIGMLQIITYLFCVYLIYKGFEILQIALMSSRDDRAIGLLIGVAAVVVAIGLALLFVKMIDAQATAVSSHVPSP